MTIPNLTYEQLFEFKTSLSSLLDEVKFYLDKNVTDKYSSQFETENALFVSKHKAVSHPEDFYNFRCFNDFIYIKRLSSGLYTVFFETDSLDGLPFECEYVSPRTWRFRFTKDKLSDIYLQYRLVVAEYCKIRWLTLDMFEDDV